MHLYQNELAQDLPHDPLGESEYQIEIDVANIEIGKALLKAFLDRAVMRVRQLRGDE